MRFRLFFLLLVVILSAQTMPAQPMPDHPRCLTPYLLERHSHPERKDSRLEILVANSARETRQRELVSPGGHFRIHYDLTGPNAVAERDQNSNSIPDYIDSAAFYLEMAWTVQIDQLGYKAPHDKGIQGPEIDVYITGLSREYYGFAFPELANVISTDPPRVTGYLVLDNDYTGYPTPGIAGLRVTSAHEFHHIVQFSSYRVDGDQPALFEATGTWMEKAVHPLLKDYRNYTDLFLGAPQDFPFSTHEVSNLGTGYGHVLYLQYLVEKFGPDIVRRIWEEFEGEERSFTAIDNALRATGNMNLEKSWCEFALWSYYTGRRAPSDSSFFDEARALPTMKESATRALDEEEMVLFQGELHPLAFLVDRVTLPGSNPNIRDTIDFLITNARGDIGKGGRQLPKEGFTLSVRPDPATDYVPMTRGENTVAYYKFTSSSSRFCIDPIMGGVRSLSLAVRTAPQPFVNDGANEMVIAVGTPGEQVTSARVWIYSSALTRVREIAQTQLTGVNNLLGVLWDGRDNSGRLVPAGIYIYELSLNGGEPTLGKFVVVSR